MKRLIKILITIFIVLYAVLLLNKIIPAKAATKSIVARRVDEIIEKRIKSKLNEPNNPLDFIPTWPKYIELEKDLILEFPKSEDYPIVQRTSLTIIKGTKIYLKEDKK